MSLKSELALELMQLDRRRDAILEEMSEILGEMEDMRQLVLAMPDEEGRPRAARPQSGRRHLQAVPVPAQVAPS